MNDSTISATLGMPLSRSGGGPLILFAFALAGVTVRAEDITRGEWKERNIIEGVLLNKLLGGFHSLSAKRN